MTAANYCDGEFVAVSEVDHVTDGVAGGPVFAVWWEMGGPAHGVTMAAEVGESSAFVKCFVDGALVDIHDASVDVDIIIGRHDGFCCSGDEFAFVGVIVVVVGVAIDLEEGVEPVFVCCSFFVLDDFSDHNTGFMVGAAGESSEVDIRVEIHGFFVGFVPFRKDVVVV